MKFDEFLKKVTQVTYASIDGTGQRILIYGGKSKYIHNDWFLMIIPSIEDLGIVYVWENAGELSTLEMFHVLEMVQKLKKTPVDQRFGGPKYRVRLKGFNSDNGPQYLTANKISKSCHGKLFACALRSDLKQKFTEDELNTIKRGQVYQRYGWVKSLIDDPENLEKVDELNE